MKRNSLNLDERVTAPTPKWFKIIRTVGITLTAVGGAILTAPIASLATIVTVGGYLILGGTVATKHWTCAVGVWLKLSFFLCVGRARVI